VRRAHEENIPAEQPKEEENPWFSSQDENQGGTGRHQEQTEKRQEKTCR